MTINENITIMIMKTETKERRCKLMKETFSKLETEILQLICEDQKDDERGKKASLWSTQIFLDNLSKKIERVAKLQKTEDFID